MNRMLWTRRYVATFAVGLAVTVLAACGGSEQTRDGSGGGTTTGSGGGPGRPGGGGAGEAPPTLAVVQPGNLAIAKAPAAGTLELAGYARLRNPAGLIDRVAAWTSAFQPAMTADALRTMMQSGGLDPRELAAGRNAAAFVWNGTPGEMSIIPPVAGLLPLSPTSQSINALTQQMGPSFVAPAGNDTLVGTPDALAKAQPLLGPLAELANAALASDIQIHVNATGLMNTYGPMLQAAMQQLLGVVAEQQSQMGGMPGAQQMLEAELRMLMEGLTQLQAVTMAVDLAPEAIEFSGVVEGKPGSGLAAFLTGGPQAAPDLAQFLSAGHLMRIQYSIADVKPWMDLNMRLLTGMESGIDAAQLEQFKADMNEFAQLGNMLMAVSGTISPEAGYIYQGIMQVDDPGKLKRLAEEKMQLVNQGALHDFYARMGIEMSVGEKKVDRQIKGWDVDSYDVAIKIGDQMQGPQRQIMEQILRPTKLEIARMGSLVLFSLGEPLDGLAARLYGESPATPLAAMKSFPAGGMMYADLSIPAYLKLISQMMGAQMPMPLPTLAADTPPLTFFGFQDGGAGEFRMKVPFGLVLAIRNATTGPGGMN